jgi:hypothetical protein
MSIGFTCRSTPWWICETVVPGSWFLCIVIPAYASIRGGTMQRFFQPLAHTHHLCSS